MATIFSLDVAFSSDTEPVRPDQPIAMACGFTHGEGAVGYDQWSADAQKETMKLNQPFTFRIFDTAKRPATLNKVEISWAKEKSPFEWTSRQFLPGGTEFNLDGAGIEISSGCNIRGFVWRSAVWNALKDGTFECTVHVWATTADGKAKRFYVDPEIIVEGAN